MSEEYVKSIMQPYNFKIPPPEKMKVIVSMLKLYKRLPCLWDQLHHHYHSKEEHNKAYSILIQKYKTIEPNATKETVRKKLDNMRCTYKREYKKVLLARVNGLPEHIPVLWYYHYLTFLDDKRNDTDSNGSDSEIRIETETTIKIEEESDDDDAVIIEPYKPCEVGGTLEVCVSPPPEKKMRLTIEESIDTKVTQSRQDKPEDSNQSLLKKSDVHNIASETFGRTVGLQLQELEPMQRYIAEKLISDVIFYGKMHRLNTETSITINDYNSYVNKSM